MMLLSFYHLGNYKDFRSCVPGDIDEDQNIVLISQYIGEKFQNLWLGQGFLT